MNAEYLLDAVGLLDDDLIREAEEYAVRKRRSNYGAWLGLAACLAVVVMLRYGVTHIGMGGAAGAPAASNGSIAPTAGEPAASGESQNGGNLAGASSAPVGGEPQTPAADGQGDYCAAIMVDGTLYWSTDTPIPAEVDESVIRTVTSYTDTVPEEDGQTNFDRDLTTRYAMTGDGLLVQMDGEWVLFDPVPPWER